MSNEENKLLEWECPKCGKKIQSLSEGQFKFNKDMHARTCKVKKENKNKVDKK